MSDPNNAYIVLGGYQHDRVRDAQSFATNALSGGVATGVLQYPLGLGGDSAKTDSNWNWSTALKVIPFTLFMPFKRSKGLDAFQSTMQGETLFTQLPRPEFAIALPTPTSALKTDYGVDYGQIEINSMVGGAVSQLGTSSRNKINNLATFKDASDLKNKTTDVYNEFSKDETIKAVTNLVKGAALNIAEKTGSLVTAEEAIPTFFGLATNPYTEYTFKNVQPRTHTFSYVFMPRSKDESKIIDRIINIFKYSMLPRPSTAAGFFEFPYEFQIVHSTQNTTFALLPSVLKSCEVDYSGGTDSPKFFTSDYPARITMTMQFQEIVLLNRDYVAKDDVLRNDAGGPATKSAFRFRF